MFTIEAPCLLARRLHGGAHIVQRADNEVVFAVAQRFRDLEAERHAAAVMPPDGLAIHPCAAVVIHAAEVK
ncbi:MAG: hypothetical protein NTW86_08825 [Candidatus Sumerlaeota bacterium]|nr:hypothetical protein [Candidatus Sumerlaeota bacterium]